MAGNGILRGGMKVTKYKVRYSGFAYVEATNAEEAVEAWEAGDEVYGEREWEEVEEVAEFPVEV